jgi:hypothetical protein
MAGVSNFLVSGVRLDLRPCAHRFALAEQAILEPLALKPRQQQSEDQRKVAYGNRRVRESDMP